jgi:hypothetical protein
MLKNKGFLRASIGRHWTIGCDLRNRAILQFVRTIPYAGQKYWRLNLGIIRISAQTRTVDKKEWRTFINFGWPAL